MIDLNDVEAVSERLMAPITYHKPEYTWRSGEVTPAHDETTEGDDWYEIHELAYGEGFTVPELGHVRLVEDFGGEGQGDDYWFVFSVTQVDEESGLSVSAMYRMDGYYASYDGGSYDGDLYMVKPQPKTVIEYVKVDA